MATKTAVVTGAASGIGLAFTQALVARSVNVLAIDLEPGPLRQLGDGVRFAAMDVRDGDGLARLAGEQSGPIAYLFANAGVGVTGAVLSGRTDLWRWGFDVNVMGVLYTLRAFWPGLVAARGTAVATVSAAALQSYPGAPIYRATKAALLALLESLYYEAAASGVRVHALCPGMVKSDIVDLARYAEWSGEAAAPAQPRDRFTMFVTQAMRTAEPAEAFAARVVDALTDPPPFYWLTHPQTLDWIEGRHRAIVGDGRPFSRFGSP